MECQENLKINAENINKNIRTIWRPIYEVINAPFLKKRIFSTRFLDLCKNNSNKPQFLPSYVRIVLKIMAMEQSLYSQVVIIFQKYLNNKI